MARQKELPNTRRADEAPPPFSHPAMDELRETICKAKRRRTRASQDVVTGIASALTKMAELKIPEYDYEYDGIKRKLKLDTRIKDVKTKIVKRDDAEGDDGDEE